ncbi:head maturation protease, ClpP-related [Marinobacter sp. SS5-14b]|uniref:head maturation protease, ClpP-related n=1 Tax=Marinobacter sp. SS5-14b TaxID=3050456 RepID=UPI0026DF0A05|nr:head maturation protease, ClpP-related [Marinobacter sp. SS5-14b]
MPAKIKALLADNEVYLYGPIGEGGITAKAFIDALKTLNTSKPVNVRINSEGGDVAHALAIYNALNEIPTVVNHIDGLAASAASVVAMAGKTVMAENAIMMIHRPWSGAVGDSDAMRKAGEILDKFQPTLVSAYAKKTGLPDAQLNDMLAAETWLTAAEALEFGFVDEVTQALAVAASADLSAFDHVPERIATIHSQIKTNYREIQNLVELHNQFNAACSVKVEALIAQGMNTPDAVRAHLLNELGKDAKPSGAIAMNNDEPLKNFFTDATDAILARNNVLSSKNLSDGARELAGMNVVAMAEKLVNLQGTSTSLMSKRQILDRAFSMHSTSDFSHLLGNVAGKSMRRAYEDEYGSHEAWTAEVEVPDFKEQTMVQLSEAPDLQKVAEGGEYKHGSFGDAAMTFRVEKYGRLFTLTREAIINDDLNAFTRLPLAFGKSAKRKEADLTYQVLTGNPKLADGKALFHADHGNLMTGSGLSTAAIDMARQAMRKQKGLNSTAPINVVPRFLIVPAALEGLAEQILNSINDPDATNDATNTAFVRGLQLVVDPRLDEVDTGAWYMAASPAQIDTVTRAYLAGEGRPHYEQREGWEIDGLHVKARLEFAAFPVDFRGLVKNPG